MSTNLIIVAEVGARGSRGQQWINRKRVWEAADERAAHEGLDLESVRAQAPIPISV